MVEETNKTTLCLNLPWNKCYLDFTGGAFLNIRQVGTSCCNIYVGKKALQTLDTDWIVKKH